MEFIHTFYNEWLWNEAFWLPKNITWKYLDEVEKSENIRIARPRDLVTAFYIAAILYVVRIGWERFIALPVGQYLKIKETVTSKPVHNEVLEKFYQQSKRVPSYKIIEELTKKTSLSVREIERWWRRRRNHDKPTEIIRWKETSWRFIYYFIAFWSGVYLHLEKPWFWDTRHCWYGYPHQDVTPDVYWYYMIQFGFYLSLVFSIFTDVRRKDFIEMNMHHFATIGLIVASWICSMVRAGTLILLLHDTVDYWMEGAKLFRYAGFQKLCDVCFVIFALLWFITRIVLFPLKLIYTCGVEINISGVGYYWWMTFPLLLILQVLHIIWFYTIIKMVFFYVVKGKVERDDRSDSDAQSSEDDLPTEGDNGKVTRNNNMQSKNKEVMCDGSANGKQNLRHRANQQP